MEAPLPKKWLYGRRRQQPSAEESDSEPAQVTDVSAGSEGEERPACSRYQCALCDFTSITSGQIVAHMRSHELPTSPRRSEPGSPDWDDETLSGVDEDEVPIPPELLDKEPPLTCNVCGKEFPIPARLLRHQRIHTGEKPFRCEFCGKTFSVKENLNVHRRIHTKERPYKCDVCSRAFEHSGKLNRHLRIHTGERPHKCTICDKAFVQSGQLVIHMRAHTGEKPYGCQTCGKAFTCSKQLKVHRRTHTGEKPYTCNICGKSFGYNHVLKTHKNSHYGQRMYKCTICSATFPQRKALEQHLADHNSSSKAVVSERLAAPPNLPALRPIQTSRPPCPSPAPPPAGLGRYLTGATGGTLVAPHPLRYSWVGRQPPLAVPIALHASQLRQSSSGSSSLERQDSPPPPPPVSFPSASPAARTSPDGVDTSFTTKVTFILTSLIGAEGLQRLGFPEHGIAEVLERALLFCSEMPCTDTGVSRLEQLKCNMRTLLLWCIPDQQQWHSYGWKDKSIEEIVDQFYSQCSRDLANKADGKTATVSASLPASLRVL